MPEKPADMAEKSTAAAADQDHQVNFFKPATEHARANMKLIVTLVVIWAIAVFGFQLLLIALQKPTPEKQYQRFESVWQAVRTGSPSAEDRQTFARALLAVLGKNIVVTPADKAVLKNALSATVLSLLPETERAAFALLLQSETERAAFLAHGAEKASADAAAAIGLENKGFDKIMISLLPYSLVKVDGATLAPPTIEALPGIMSLYLTHNQSALTDFRFLGFPFHYWFTAQFLLILFVLLCLVYAVAIDRIHTKYGFIEE